MTGTTSEGWPDDHERFVEATDPLRTAMMRLVALQRSERGRLSATPGPGTVAGKDDLRAELLGELGVGRPALARSFAQIHLAAAEELIESISTLEAGRPAVVVSDRVLLRSALEACGRVNWLVDAHATADQRLARGLAEWIEDLRQRKHLTTAEHAEQLQAKREFLRGQIQAAGWTTRRGDDGSLEVAGESRPRPTVAVTLSMGEGFADVQKFLSHAVHSNPVSLMMNRATDLEHVKLGGGLVGAPIVATSEEASFLMMMAGVAYINAVGNFRLLMGWKGPEWDKAASDFREACAVHVDLTSN